MEIVKWTLLSLLTTGHGAVVGFGITSRKIIVVWYHIAGLILLSFLLSIASSFMGQWLGDWLSIRALEVLFGLFIIGIGIYLVLNKPSYPGYRDLLLLSLALQIDVFLLSFYYGLTHQGAYGLAFTLALLLLGSVVGGMIYGGKRWSNWRIQLLVPQLAGILLVIIGLIKVL